MAPFILSWAISAIFMFGMFRCTQTMRMSLFYPPNEGAVV